MASYRYGSNGPEVERIQNRLIELGFDPGDPDGAFGRRTEGAVRDFQASAGLDDDGVVGPITMGSLFREPASPSPVAPSGPLSPFFPLSEDLLEFHAFEGGVRWRLTRSGIEVDGAGIERTPGEPRTVRRVWEENRTAIERWSRHYKVPPELIVATICTETGGDPRRVREEPGYVSDQQTPHRVSPGIMQTLISTARSALGDPAIDRDWLLVPENSIRAGTSYISRQGRRTGLDPPKVACAYNAGGLYLQKGSANRWKMRQYPIGTSHHADRFVQWINDFFAVVNQGQVTPSRSFFGAAARADE